MRRFIARRLYLQIYLAFIGVLMLTLAAAGITNRLISEGVGEVPQPIHAAAELLVMGLPADQGPPLEEALRRRSVRLEMALAMWSADGTLLAYSGPKGARKAGGTHARRLHEQEARMPNPTDGRGERWFSTSAGYGARVELADGRWLAGLVPKHHSAPRHRRSAVVLAAVFAAMAAGSYPIARRITRRLESLKAGADGLAAGDLSSRVEVEGRDEVAELARAFNGAADRIEVLVESQRRMLASASHELRSPLARLRMALALLEEGPDEAGPDEARRALLDGAGKDIEELDDLIEDLLLSSRLEASPLRERAPVALLGLLTEEAARVGASTSGEEVLVLGERRALRRMVRNLLENALKHGGGEVEAWIEPAAGAALVVVADRGAGVPEDQRERIFEPFYRPQGHREAADGGVGLGLALVRQIAQQHGGTARCVAREGGGSRFEIALPLELS